jgi:hypothetical protein
MASRRLEYRRLSARELAVPDQFFEQTLRVRFVGMMPTDQNIGILESTRITSAHCLRLRIRFPQAYCQCLGRDSHVQRPYG